MDICRGLDYAFQRGISHKDLKASNVLISSLGQAKLLDFGLAGTDPNSSDAELAKSGKSARSIMRHWSVAQACARTTCAATSSFSGCIFYNMLSGKPALEEMQDRLRG